MAQTLAPSLVRIKDTHGQPVGAGFLVTGRKVLTCAHVVAAARLGEASEPVSLDFPLLPDSQPMSARVMFWDEAADVAGLELTCDPPAEAKPVRLVHIADLWGHTFRAFGFPAGYEQGVWSSGRLLDQDANGWLQVEDTKTTGFPISPGFSGGPIWDDEAQAVVGMVVAVEGDPQVRAAFGLPVALLVKTWAELAENQVSACPYRGLFAFREVDAPLFFGREGFVQRLVEAAERKSFLAVIGPSGSGKSSVVFAGLVPQLRRQSWVIADFRPGAKPFEALAQALLPFLEADLSETDRLVELRKLSSALQNQEIELSALLDRIRQKSQVPHFLLVADQFEELYTLSPNPPTQQRFLDLLLSLCQSPEWVLLLTLRADFMGQALAYRPFADALQEADLKLGPMTREELHTAVEQPANVYGVQFEPGLVERILDEVIDQPGALPLLEFALAQLWEDQRGSILTHASYETTGRVEGALAHYADQVLVRLTAEEQVQARRIFTQLVAPGAGTEDTRRLAAREELSSGDWRLVTRLADARLVVTDQTPLGEEAAEVVHEALIRSWGKLREWMEADRRFRAWQERLRASLRQWQANREDPGGLLRGAPLAEAEGWLESDGAALSEPERRYLRASLEQRQAEQKAERRRWLTTFGVISAAVVLVAVVLTLSLTGQLNRFIYRPLPMEEVTIPVGKFQMGCDPAHNRGYECFEGELPLHTVSLDEFKIGKYEVTNAQYTQCVKAGVCSAPGNSRFNNPEYQDHPVTDVSWMDAQTFCDWNGGRLPSEAEWEKAARGAADTRAYPWGDEPPDCQRANFYYEQNSQICVGDTSPVGSYPAGASPYGVLDMAGNAWEWVNDWSDSSYYSSSTASNPPGPESGNSRVLRGGGWGDSPSYLRVAFRYGVNPGSRAYLIGIRCVVSSGR